MSADVNSHQHRTIEKLFGHPTGGNIEWREIVTLLESLGAMTEERNGKFKVTLGSETEVFEVPRGKDIEVQATVDLRRMLGAAGLAPDEQTTTPGGPVNG